MCLTKLIQSLPLKKAVLCVTFCHNLLCVFGEELCILYNMSRTISKWVTSSISLTSLMASLCSQSFAKCKLRFRPSHTCSLPFVSDVSSVEKATKFRKRIHPWNICCLIESTDVVWSLYLGREGAGNLLLQF